MVPLSVGLRPLCILRSGFTFEFEVGLLLLAQFLLVCVLDVEDLVVGVLLDLTLRLLVFPAHQPRLLVRLQTKAPQPRDSPAFHPKTKPPQPRDSPAFYVKRNCRSQNRLLPCERRVTRKRKPEQEAVQRHWVRCHTPPPSLGLGTTFGEHDALTPGEWRA